MEMILDKAIKIGGFMAIVGLVSSVLYLMDMNLRVLMFIDMWGPVVGWIIRIGLIVVGGGLALLGFVFTDDEEPA